MPVIDWRLRDERLVTGSAKCLRQIQHDLFKSRRSVGFSHMDVHIVCGEILAPSDERTPGVYRVERPAAEADGEETDRDNAAGSEEEEGTFETLRINSERNRNEQRHRERNEKSNDRGYDMFGRGFRSKTPRLKDTGLVKSVIPDKETCTKGTNTSVIASKISVPIARGTILPSR